VRHCCSLFVQIFQLPGADYDEIFGTADGVCDAPPQLAPVLAGLGCAEGAMLWMPQGGAVAAAEEGVRMLAHEITRAWLGVDASDAQACDAVPAEGAGVLYAGGTRLCVVVPGGTGATALFLARHLQPSGIDVAVVPCVGDTGGRYFLRQMQRLDSITGGGGLRPPLPRTGTPRPV